MSLKRVDISSDVYFVCLSHALTTEIEEVMGLLLGDIEETASGSVSHVTAVSVLARLDKRKDRVEISAEQLAAATQEAEKLSEALGKRTRVVGWYHSHPHITVFPSRVDVETQASYQMLDRGFVGLIFSCFNKDPADTSDRVQVLGFQSYDSRRPAPPSARGHSRNSSTSGMPSSSSGRRDVINLDDSPPHSQSSLDAELENAMDISGNEAQAGFEHIEIPIQIVPPPRNGPNLLEKLVDLQRILAGEEQAAYFASLVPPTGYDEALPVVKRHSAAVFEKALCRLFELQQVPLMLALDQRLSEATQQIELLEKEKAYLKKKLKKRRAIHVTDAEAHSDHEMADSPASPDY
eukprot:TRINITY_DN5766_c2_g1_i1.p2 TRINITY_DN5766_c2_g1~~TRINITY_DN5766_c2_g1_i1.p2  ORF type:complete len:350 (+),score=128.36 TRINITY_DN5766_c2_g1_i1:128-1177(+)